MTRRFCVFGNPIAHSQSPQIHEWFAEQFGHSLSYQRKLATEGRFSRCVATAFRNGLSGANVTVPFKLQAQKLATQLTPEGAFAGSVNTLIPRSCGGILGANTDGRGLIFDLERQGMELQDRKVLLIGAGGAARGVLKNLVDAKPGKLWVYNRSVDKARALSAMSPGIGCVDDWSAVDSVDVMINATSASLTGGVPDIPERLYAQLESVYDMVYGTQPTAFLRYARERSDARWSDGLGMLVGQAAESYRLWWQSDLPAIETVIQRLRQRLNAPG